MAKKILIVDDENDILMMLQNRLQASKFEVDTASNGADGLAKAQSGHPDLILLDLMMPVMDGYEVLEKLKASDKTSGIPVLILSAKGEKADRTKTIESGAVDHYVKPFPASLLIKRIGEILKN